ncbi:kinase-like domain-containing protein [Mycena galopus ATCC 62051]|nr:kinase-like domain-containing protein [Mycena galopus ATCC 62051]
MTVRHPRILRYYGTRDGELELEFHRNGDLWTYLVQREPSLTTRVQWAVQIAEGLAALHSHSIVWADGHFRNILVTTNLNVVLCDFAYSLSSPQQFTVLSTAPPPVFVAPYGYFGRDPVYFDIFAYGVMLFALLSNRFPWTCDLRADWETQRRALEKHGSRQFDSLEVAELNTHFGRVVEQCFRATYRSGTELLGDISKARDSWLKFTL